MCRLFYLKWNFTEVSELRKLPLYKVVLIKVGIKGKLMRVIPLLLLVVGFVLVNVNVRDVKNLMVDGKRKMC